MGHGDRPNIVAAVLLLLSVITFSRGAGTDLGRAEELYNRAECRLAHNILVLLSPKSAAVCAPIGTTYYMDAQYKSSTAYLESAVAQDSLNSSYCAWLGKADGRSAEQSRFLTALACARQTREYFEKAEVDETTQGALGDLFEYRHEAPGVVGGGIDKAENVGELISRLNQVEGHYALAQIAEKRRERQTAEREYSTAMQLVPCHNGRVFDLSVFLAKQGRYQESEQLFDLARQIAPDSPKLLVARAVPYIQTERNLPEASALIQRYIGSPHKPDDPSRSEVELLLKASLKRDGFAPGAPFRAIHS